MLFSGSQRYWCLWVVARFLPLSIPLLLALAAEQSAVLTNNALPVRSTMHLWRRSRRCTASTRCSQRCAPRRDSALCLLALAGLGVLSSAEVVHSLFAYKLRTAARSNSEQNVCLWHSEKRRPTPPYLLTASLAAGAQLQAKQSVM